MKLVFRMKLRSYRNHLKRIGVCFLRIYKYCSFVTKYQDIVSAPRPLSPPVRRLAMTEEEKENALEYGLPSSHTLNTICLSGYLIYYVNSNLNNTNGCAFKLVVISLLVTLSLLIGIGRIYLGMHSLIDVVGAAVLGTMILIFWFTVHERLDSFVTSGKNVTFFWAIFAFLLLFAYPTPELPTPSFEFHVAFNGVAIGVVTGINRTFLEFHNEHVPRLFGPRLGATMFFKRVMIGLPIIIVVKFISKALAKGLLPLICNLIGVPIKFSSYIQPVKGVTVSAVKSQGVDQSGYSQKIFLSPPESYGVDTSIRLLQYAGLSWAVVELVPLVFQYMGL